jgi:hypothetical protein
MKLITYLTLLALSCGALTSCKPKSTADGSTSDDNAPRMANGRKWEPAIVEAAAKLRPAKDPIEEEMVAFRVPIRDAFIKRRFDELERTIAEMRAKKEILGNGWWNLSNFYIALSTEEKATESEWQASAQLFRDWLAAKPESSAARIAYARHLTDYAWKARGNGYADSVSQKSWELFGERLNEALKLLKEARKMPEKDAYLWRSVFTVAMGQGWDKSAYDELVKEAHAAEPTFWPYDTSRAYSLLPRWYGEPGDWEAFAEETAARPDGLGVELYARIVMDQQHYYKNIFQETKVSWPKTREGLAVLRKKYPKCLEILNYTAMLAGMTDDQATTKEAFDLLGDGYLPSVWGKPERFIQYRRWAETGRW